jgi:hypothetical protein
VENFLQHNHPIHSKQPLPGTKITLQDTPKKITPEIPGVNVCGFSDRFVRVSNSGTAVDGFKNGKEIRSDAKKGGFFRDTKDEEFTDGECLRGDCAI